MPVVDTFQAQHTRLRNSWAAMNRQEAVGLWGIFDDLLRDVQGEIVKHYEPGVAWLSSERRVMLSRALEVEATRFADAYGNYIDNAMRKSANLPLSSQAAGRAYYADLCRHAGAGNLATELEALSALSFAQIPTATVEALANRMVKGMNLSGRIWNLTEAGMQDVQQILTAGAIGGKDVGWISRAVESNIRPGHKGPGWTSRGKPAKRPLPTGGYVGMKGRPYMYYSAARLARTEMRLCAHDGQVRGQVATRALMEPEGLNYLLGLHWNLSVSHPRFDICDDYASGGSSGLPAGVFHPEDVPSSHSLCMCYLTDEMMPPAEFAKKLDARRDRDRPPKVTAAAAMGKAVKTKRTPGMKSLAAAEATDRRAMKTAKKKAGKK